MNLHTGLSEQARKEVSEGLSHVLADTYVLYLKTQNFHWNVKGPMFPSYHLLFEEQYTDLAMAADEIAERIRALGFPAPASFAQFSKLSHIKEETGVPKAEEMIRQLLHDHETVIKSFQAVLKRAEELGDDLTVDLLTQRLRTHEKTAWMLRSSLE